MIRKKVCVVTGSRAEYGVIYHILRAIVASPSLEMQLVVTGTHLCREYGYTIDEIRKDGFIVTDTVDIDVGSDDLASIAKSIGLGVIGFADCFRRLAPDIILLTGDRYEMLAVASAAMALNCPIAHISGGELTYGVIDEQIRHAITKMSHLHLVAGPDNARRVKQMGEEDWRVHVVGGPWVENEKKLQRLSRQEIDGLLGFSFRSPSIMVTYHPETSNIPHLSEYLDCVFGALEQIDADMIFTYPNADAGGQQIIKRIDQFVKTHDRARSYQSLGRLLYHNVLGHVDLMFGNSSSGMVESQYYKLPVINIGDRQKGRTVTANILSVGYDVKEITDAVRKGLSDEFRKGLAQMVNPYQKDNASEAVVQILETAPAKQKLLYKQFVEINS
ncbi:MAG: UDP-N-acetylglucosamine 2-epimerase (hydrolyzing) [Candidatus Omnitrophica bacterium]|nr:UDP-N-acetylglucosamine 2-epimerase (hydrolyzing) [Candidatus Omnitrophota bacterium]